MRKVFYRSGVIDLPSRQNDDFFLLIGNRKASKLISCTYSCVLLLATTAQFLVGSTLDKVGCEALDDPRNSELFGLIDDKIITPHLEEQIRLSSSGAQSAGKGHTSLRKILGQVQWCLEN